MLKKIKELLFTNRSTKQTIIKNTIWLTGSTIISRSIRALVIIYAARILGTEGYGVFSYAMSLAAFFSIFSDLGLSGLLTREIAKEPEKKSNYIATIFYLKAAILLGTVLFTFFFSSYFVKIAAAKPLIPLAVLLILFDGIRGFGFSFARAQNKMEIEGFLSVATDILITVLGLSALFLIPSTFSLSLAYLLGSIVGTILTFFFLWKGIKTLSGNFEKTLVKSILRTSLPFVIAGIFGAFMINIDTVILGFFRTPGELGLYSAAQRPVQLLYVLPALLAGSIFPIISKLIKEDNKKAIKIIIEKSTASVMLLALPLVIGGIILAAPLIHLLFGSLYMNSVVCFQLLLITILFVFPGVGFINAIFSMNLQKKLIWTTGAGALVNVVLDLILIPSYGIEGSAIATIIAQIVTNGLNWWILKKELNIQTVHFLKNIIFASIIMGLVTVFLLIIKIPVLITIALSAGVYGYALFILKEETFFSFKDILLKLKNR